MRATPRREIYRRTKRLLVKLLVSRWDGSRRSLERCVWRFLRGRRRQYLLQLLREQTVAAAAAGLILMAGVAHGDPLISASDIAAGNGGFAIIGTQGQIGFSVSGGADISGDGLDDVIIGAPFGYYNDAFPGKVYVVFGKGNTSSVDASTIESGAGGGYVINGNSQSKPIGSAVGSAGVINNGANADLVMSGDSNQFGGSSPVYVVHGKGTTTPMNISGPASGSGGFVITGIDTMYSAAPVYAFGDINGDGRDDIVIGASYYNNYTGRVYVAFGKNGTAAVTTTDLANGIGGFVIDGAGNFHQAGSSVSIVPDMTGDGRDEIVVGARGAGGMGEAYVVFGRGVGGPVDLGSFTNGFRIHGGYSGEYVGRRVAGSEDINGDGRGDIIMGAPYNDSSSDGNVYVIFGKHSNVAVNTQDIANGVGGFQIHGRDLNATAGTSVSGAGDLNGDGLEDIIIGSYRTTVPGEAYVVFGKSSTTSVFLEDVWSGVGGFGIAGAANNDGLGRSVSRAGDVNGDGVDDVVVGAPGANRAYVVFGKNPAPVSVGLTSSQTGNPISSGVVFVERTDAPVGFRAPLAGLIGGNAVYRSQFTDIGDFNVQAIASGFKASDPVAVSNDGGVPGIQLDPDGDIAEPNILTVVIRVVNQVGQPTGQRILTKTAALFQNESPLGITPLYGRGTMVFVGVPAGEVDIVIPDTTQHDFVDKTVLLGTGVDQTVIVDAVLLDGAAPRAELPGIVLGAVLNGSSDPIVEYAEPLVIHTLNANGLATSTFGTVDGAYVFPDVVAGAGVVQAFSNDGTVAGSSKGVNVTSGQIYGDQPSEDTLLSVSPPSDDSDFDGLPDAFEEQYLSTVPSNLRGPDDDPDLDGLTNLEEMIAGTHPANFDSDSDGVGDGVELVLGANPNNAGSKPGLQSTVYVDFGHAEPLQAGLLLHPYRTLQEAIGRLQSGGTVRIKGDVTVTTGSRPSGAISKPMRIEALNGTIRIE